MIIGTAGHIDHGKTTLVHALTGVDTDRLPEEKSRGISIELGYAFLDDPLTGARIGFVDVPGHERLVHTMLAGATGIDFALLLVAADDGVMPQTREHLAVLSLLGLTRAAIVITKIDRVGASRLEAVMADVSRLVADTPLASAPLLPVSARTAEGIADLRERLFEAARDTPDHAPDAFGFRLAVDRAFTLTGAGTVATGTVHAGRVRIGDELVLTPGAAVQARVRSLHAQNRAVDEAQAGQRCAVALVGVSKEAFTRGQWWTNGNIANATDRFDVALSLWHEEPRPLRSGTPVHVHIGASDTLGTVAVLQAESSDSVRPGGQAIVQIVLREPIGCWRGDRVVLRDTSASRTIAGGTVLDPFAPARYRRTPQRLAELAACALPTADDRLAGAIASAPHGVSLGRWMRAEGRTGAAPRLPHGTLRALDADHVEWLLGAEHAASVTAQALTALRGFHVREPDMAGPDAARLRRLAAPRLPDTLWRALLVTLQRDGRVAGRGSFVQLPEHALRLSAVDERIAQKIAPLLATPGFDGHWVRDFARDARESEALMRMTLARFAHAGELHQVVKDLYYGPATMEALAAQARRLSEAGPVTAAAFRDATGLGRKRAIQILEYFDRVGLLRRVGDEHRLRRDCTLFMP